MKKLTYFLLAFIAACFIIQGCKKLEGVIAAGGQLSATKTEVKMNEPDTVLAVKAKATDNISWLVTPSGFNTISTKDNAAAFVFSKAGTYTVKATINGASTDGLKIKVTDGVYVPPANTTLSLTGDQIIIEPQIYKSAHSDTAYIYFQTHTANTYCPNGKLMYTSGVDANNNYMLNFTGVLQYAGCSGTPAFMRANINLKQNTIGLVNGTYPLNITLNGTTYTGSIVVATANITFNWEYTSGVTIAPKVRNR
jgi:hypothetical protein